MILKSITNRIGLKIGKEYEIFEDPTEKEYYITKCGIFFIKSNLYKYFEKNIPDSE